MDTHPEGMTTELIRDMSGSVLMDIVNFLTKEDYDEQYDSDVFHLLMYSSFLPTPKLGHTFLT